MSYFVGRNLTRKVAEFGLGSLDKALENYANGSPWIGNQSISCDPTYFGSLRIVVYSLLHHHGVKSDFTIKMFPARSAIELHHRVSPSAIRSTHMAPAQVEKDPGRMARAIFGDEKELDNVAKAE